MNKWCQENNSIILGVLNWIVFIIILWNDYKLPLNAQDFFVMYFIYISFITTIIALGINARLIYKKKYISENRLF